MGYFRSVVHILSNEFSLINEFIHELRDNSPDHPEDVDSVVNWNLEQNLTDW